MPKWFQSISSSRKAILGLISIVLAAAYTPIIIRYAQAENVPSLTIILLRLWIIALALTPIILTRHRADFRGLTRRDWAWVGAAGILHAVNLSLLFFSLEYTSVLINSVLRRTSPLWTAGMEVLFLSAMFSRRVWWGALLIVFGTTLVGLGSSAGGVGSHYLLGGGLALLNALTDSVYFVIGRRIRHKIPYLPYSWAVFVGAAITTSVAVLVTHTPVLGLSAWGYWLVFWIAVLAQVFGHIPINGVLRHIPATMLTISLQLSVIVSAVLAIFLLGEFPSAWQLVGSGLILVGVVVATGRG